MSDDRMIRPTWGEFYGLLAEEYDRIGRYMNLVSDGALGLPAIGDDEHPVWTRYEWVRSIRPDVAKARGIGDSHHTVIMMALRAWTRVVDTVEYYIDTNGADKAKVELSSELIALAQAISPMHTH